jgi:hypothetical protein
MAPFGAISPSPETGQKRQCVEFASDGLGGREGQMSPVGDSPGIAPAGARRDVVGSGMPPNPNLTYHC